MFDTHGTRVGPGTAIGFRTEPSIQGELAIIKPIPLTDPTVWWLPCEQRIEYAGTNLRSPIATTIGQQLIINGGKYGTLAVETAKSSRIIPIPEKFEHTSISPTSRSGMIVLRNTDEFAIVDINTDEVRELTPTLPTGLRAVRIQGSDKLRALDVTADGDLLVPLRNDAEAHLYRTRDGVQWQSVGLPVGKASGMDALSVADTTVLLARSWEPDEWTQPSPDRIDFAHVQVVSSTQTAEIIDQESTMPQHRYYRVTRDGGCVGSVRGSTWRGYHVPSRTHFSLALPTATDVWTWTGHGDETIQATF